MDGPDVRLAVLTAVGVLLVAVGIALGLGIGWGLVAAGALLLVLAERLLRLFLDAAPAEPDPAEPIDVPVEHV